MMRVFLPIAAALMLPACGSSSLGVIVGGVRPCTGLPPRPGDPTFAAATVTARSGAVTWRTTGPGSYAPILPAAVAARATTVTNGTYEFDLTPGHYVLAEELSSQPNYVEPYVEVDVKAGSTLHVDIPNVCH